MYAKQHWQLTAVSEECDVDVVTDGNEPQRVTDEARDVRFMVDKYCTTQDTSFFLPVSASV